MDPCAGWWKPRQIGLRQEVAPGQLFSTQNAPLMVHSGDGAFRRASRSKSGSPPDPSPSRTMRWSASWDIFEEGMGSPCFPNKAPLRCGQQAGLPGGDQLFDEDPRGMMLISRAFQSFITCRARCRSRPPPGLLGRPSQDLQPRPAKFQASPHPRCCPNEPLQSPALQFAAPPGAFGDL